MCTSIYLASTFINKQHILPRIPKPSAYLALPKPQNIGILTIKKIDNTPATVITAGDSLARGKGSIIINGTLANIGYYLVRHANSDNTKNASYEVIPGLSIDGSSVEQLTTRLNSQSNTLAKIPNLILLLSFTNKDMNNFVYSAEKVHSSTRIGAFFTIAQLLNSDSVQYRYSLDSLASALNRIHNIREKILGKELSTMQVAVLGLPNELYSPSVQEVLQTYHVTPTEFSYVINLFNTDDQKAMVLANSNHTGIAYSFINLDNIQISNNTALADLSNDKFHPNSLGYQALTNYISENVMIQQDKSNIFLAKK